MGSLDISTSEKHLESSQIEVYHRLSADARSSSSDENSFSNHWFSPFVGFVLAHVDTDGKEEVEEYECTDNNG